jgi:tRNA-dihydrouridine synthase
VLIEEQNLTFSRLERKDKGFPVKMNPTTMPINFPLSLAPMVGLSHVALRLTLREYTPPGVKTIWPTEMLNSRRLAEETVGSTPATYKRADEDGLVPQILGNEERPIAESVRRLVAWGAEGIDINMGCPVEKALRHNYGVALMGDPVYAAAVVGMAARHSTVPVSVKLRAGHQNDFDYLLNFVRGLRDGGASWITLHPRTAEQRRRGKADWTQIKRLKDSVDFPIVGNGDIQIADDVFSMMEETGCDQVMAGRALAARPWMMWQVGESLGWAPPLGRTGPAPRTPEEEGAEFGRALLSLIGHCRTYFTEEMALRKVRFHLRTTSPWLTFGHTLSSISTKAKTFEEMIPMIDAFFSLPQTMVERTELRS